MSVPNVPNIRRGTKKPKAFSRNSIEIGPVGREWKTIPANSIAVGDTLAGFGVVGQISIRDNKYSQNEPFVIIKSEMNRIGRFSPEELVMAFVEKSSEQKP